MGTVLKGEVKWFDAVKGYGFIASDAGEDFFVHHSSILSGVSKYKNLQKGEKVEFEIVHGKKGLSAGNVKVVSPE